MSIEAFNAIISDNPIAFGSISFLSGYLVGHWLALGRDKRKEFNAACMPIREWLVKDIDLGRPAHAYPTAVEIDVFMRYLPWFKRTSFLRKYKNCQEESQKAMVQDPIGGSISYPDTKAYINALKSCLPYCRLN